MNGWLIYSRAEAGRNSWFIGRLQEAARDWNIILDVKLEEELASLEDLPDFVLYRGRDFTVSRKLESAGVRVFNRSEVSRIANDKFQTAQMAQLLGIPVIPTAALSSPESVRQYPAVAKTADGHGGSGVRLLSSAEDTAALLAERPEETWLVQPYVEHGATDVRLYMLGDLCIGAVKRRGSDTFKSNVSLGGSAERFVPPAALERMAETLAKALKSDYIGVDFIRSEDGVWLLNEIEDPVGARSLYATGGRDIAADLVEYISSRLHR